VLVLRELSSALPRVTPLQRPTDSWCRFPAVTQGVPNTTSLRARMGRAPCCRRTAHAGWAGRGAGLSLPWSPPPVTPADSCAHRSQRASIRVV